MRVCGQRTSHMRVYGQQVDISGTHGLACRKSAGRHVRHNAANDQIKRALTSAYIPAMLEPNYLRRDDGERPDGLTLGQWSMPGMGFFPVPTHWPPVS